MTKLPYEEVAEELQRVSSCEGTKKKMEVQNEGKIVQ